MKQTIFLLLIASLITSCNGTINYQVTKMPQEIPQPKLPEKIRVALVLGGGGARGFAHIGVLEEFERAQIPIDLIVGCSVGSIIGALYCDRLNAEVIRKMLAPLKVNDFMNINIFKAWCGLSQGTGLQKTLGIFLQAKRFEDLKLPLLVTATDLSEGTLVTLGSGPLIPAIHASSAIPVAFAPVEHYGRILVDGGILASVPIEAAKAVKPDYIIAVDLFGHLEKAEPGNILQIAERSAEIMMHTQAKSHLKNADIVIQPALANISIFAEGSNDEIYEAGREAARQAIPKIKELLQPR